MFGFGKERIIMHFEFQIFVVLGMVVFSSGGSMIHVTTKIDEPILLSDYGFKLGTAISFVFQVKSINMLLIRFVNQNSLSQDDLVFKVALDKDGKKSIIKVHPDITDIAIATYEGRILTSGVYNTFRIGWKDKVITVSEPGSESTWNTFLCAEYTPLNISEIKFITIKSPLSVAEWDVYLDDPFTNVSLPTKCPQQSTESAHLINALSTSPNIVNQAVMTSSTVYLLASDKSESSFNTQSAVDTSTSAYSINTEPLESSLNTPNDWNSITASTKAINAELLESSSYAPYNGTTLTTENSTNTSFFASTNTINVEPLESTSKTQYDGKTVTTGYSINTSILVSTEAMTTNQSGSYKDNNTNCRWVCESIIPKVELQMMVNALQKELKWQKNTTSSYIRSKTSASDFRSSSATIGYFGAFILSAMAVGILLLDFSKLIQTKNKCYNRKVNPST